MEEAIRSGNNSRLVDLVERIKCDRVLTQEAQRSLNEAARDETTPQTVALLRELTELVSQGTVRVTQ